MITAPVQDIYANSNLDVVLKDVDNVAAMPIISGKETSSTELSYL